MATNPKYSQVDVSTEEDHHGGLENASYVADHTLPSDANYISHKNNTMSSKVDNFQLDSNDVEPTIEWVKGDVQEPGFKDVYFAVAFLVNLVAVGTAAVVLKEDAYNATQKIASRRLSDYNSYGRTDDGYNTDETSSASSSDVDDDSYVFAIVLVIAISFILASVLSIGALSTMQNHATTLIQWSLYFAIGINGIACIMNVVALSLYAAFLHALFVFLLVMYAKAVWHRIPYAAAILRSSVTAIRSNLGVAFMAFCALPLQIGWIGMWIVSFMGTLQSDFMKTQYEEVDQSNSNNYGSGGSKEEILSPIGYMVIFLFILSLHWTSQVIKNTVHTTVAGVIGTWWFLPEEASSCCSKGLTDSFSRSMTYSFGSICFGSLIVAILEVIRSSLRNAQNNRNGGVLRCIAYCLLTWIEALVEYFNKWAFVYVGLYGYSYMEAGKNVMTLFRSRGWTTVISDNLVVRMLSVMSLGIGMIVALVATLVGLVNGIHDISLVPMTLIGLVTGIMFSGIIMNVVLSSVDSIIVLYAESPAEFQANHPALHNEVNSAWVDAWPTVPLASASVLEVPNGENATPRQSFV